MKRVMILLLVIVVLNFSAIATAATIHVPGDQSTIQAGIDVATDGDLVLVDPGTYVENINFLGKAITVQSEGGAEVTVIDGNQGGSVVMFVNKETRDTIIDGFTIIHGEASYDYGGGVCCQSSSPTIMNCIISENDAYYFGGGIFCGSNALPIIISCVISSNNAQHSGGGICCFPYSYVLIENSVMIGNNAEYAGGGIYTSLSTLTIKGCDLTENVAGNNGGGINCENSSSVIMINCTIIKNNSDDHGGGVYNSESSLTMENCTVAKNNTKYGGGIYFGLDSLATIINCISWDNKALEGKEIWIGTFISPSVITISYSDIQGGESAIYMELGCILNWLDGNINIDPSFVGGDDYHLTIDSPCIDSGTDAGVYTDIDGEERPWGSGFDMGADEFVLTDCDSDDDGYDHPYCGGDDCDDSNLDTHPGAPEICDGKDNNCDGMVPADETDADGDGFRICEGDCDDNNPATYPGALETCDGQDNNCDEVVPEDEVDNDGDGAMICDGDCDDSDPTVYPGAPEICDFTDNNCDGAVDEGFDWDSDGWTGCGGDCDDSDSTIHPGAPDLKGDGIDQDCDGCDGVCPPCFIGSVT